MANPSKIVVAIATIALLAIVAMPPASAATTLSVGISDVDVTSVSLRWSQTGDLAFMAYRVMMNGGLVEEIRNAAQTSTIIAGLDPNTYYSFRVDDVDIFGTQASNTVSARTLPPPLDAVQLSIVDTGLDYVSLRWTEATSPWFNSYHVLQGSMIVTSLFDHMVTTYTIRGLNDASTYRFTVEVRSAYDTGVASNTVTTTTDAIPLPPPGPAPEPTPGEVVTGAYSIWGTAAVFIALPIVALLAAHVLYRLRVKHGIRMLRVRQEREYGLAARWLGAEAQNDYVPALSVEGANEHARYGVLQHKVAQRRLGSETETFEKQQDVTRRRLEVDAITYSARTEADTTEHIARKDASAKAASEYERLHLNRERELLPSGEHGRRLEAGQQANDHAVKLEELRQRFIEAKYRYETEIERKAERDVRAQREHEARMKRIPSKTIRREEYAVDVDRG